MIELDAIGVRVRVHALALLLPALGFALGLRAEMPALLLSLTVHETGHLIAARLARVRVEALTVTPFGCGLRLGNIYALSPGQILAASAGGPLASLLLAFADGALAHWRLLSSGFALCLLRITLLLTLFNLLPALPLDGGRMLYALTAPRLGRQRAARLGARLGRAVALCLVAGTAWLWASTGRLNITLPACAAFIVAGVEADLRALGDAVPAPLLHLLKASDAPLPIRLYAVSDDYPVLKAVRAAAPNAAAVYALFRNGGFTGLVDERAALALAVQRPDARIGDAKKARFRTA